MEKTITRLSNTIFVFVAVIAMSQSISLAATEVALRGVGEPPFLGEGVPANVMLLIDNSASMYDMAYDDIQEPGFCLDDSYIFEGTINPDEWLAAASYAEGTFVSVRSWNGTDEAWEKKWYKSNVAVAINGASPATSGDWDAAEWSSGVTYTEGNIVVIQESFTQDDGSVTYVYDWYMVIVAATADEAPAIVETSWQRIPSMYGGYFENDQWYQWSDTEGMFVRIAQPASSAAACSKFVAAPHELYTNDDLCQVIEPIGYTYAQIDFAAKGNFLNWAASSKFDVEKKVLTGGKYINPDGNDVSTAPDNYLIKESRGCQGRRMIREISVENTAGDPRILVIAIGKAEEEGGGGSLAGCKASCDPPGATCVSDCNDTCTPGCAVTGCTKDCPAERATCDAGCQTDFDTCMISFENTYTACMADVLSDFNACETKWCGKNASKCAACSVTRSDAEDDCADARDQSQAATCDLPQTQCQETCVADEATCVADYCGGVDAACVATCDANCKTTCKTQCESACDAAWVGVNTGQNDDATVMQFWPPLDNTGLDLGSACADAIAAAPSSSMGTFKGNIDSCLNLPKQNEDPLGLNAPFNHGISVCWQKYDPETKVGGLNWNDINQDANHCPDIWLTGIDPADITTSNNGYLCSGDASNGTGYVGRCFLGLDAATCTFDPCPSPLQPGQRCLEGTLFYDCPADFLWDASMGSCLYDDNGTPDPNKISPLALQTTGKCDVLWVPGSLNDDNGCMAQAYEDFCGELVAPPVPDAERLVGAVAGGKYPNLPAILTDAATQGQLGSPIKVLPVLVQGERWEDTSTTPSTYKEVPPTGLLQNVTGDLRIGAMTFNARGTAWEMNQASAVVQNQAALYGCVPGAGCDNKDGAIVIDYINDSSDSGSLVQSINHVKAASWTPMAEAMYNAIGYYTRNKRLSVSDFYKKTDTAATWASGTDYTLGALVKNAAGDVFWAVTEGESAGTSSDLAAGTDTGIQWELLKEAGDPDSVLDPVLAYCQSNNILVLTDGASTGDWNSVVTTFAADISNGDTDITTQCDRFYGSTYVDEMAYYGQSGKDIYREEQYVPLFGADATKENIQTYVVTTGALRVDGPEDQCRADVLLKETAEQGGTDRFYPGEDVTQLQDQLTLIFNSLRSRASAGSAASVISSSRGGEGAIYQAIFWPEQEETDAFGNEYKVSWIGDVHSLFIDDKGFMYEDTNGDGSMTPWEDTDSDGNCPVGGTEGDCRVIIYYFDKETRACRNSTIYTNGICSGPDQDIGLKNVKFLWSAAEQLSDIPDTDIITNRSYSATTNQRYIFTWNDLDNDGAVAIDGSETLPFTVAADLTAETVSGGRGSVINDFDAMDKTEVDSIINWVRGEDQIGMRSREYTFGKTWRLGDVIHSTPMVVAAPAEAYNLINHDLSYAVFSAKWKNRRQMIYYGANDGMLHAVNGGFYDVANRAFSLGFNDKGTPDPSDDVYTTTGPSLGNERWAYVPYNILPHLKSLTQTDYVDKHKYFVDLRPRIFDAQIFDPDVDHPYGWGTILVGGMRFGGAPVAAAELPFPEDSSVTKNPGTDKRIFTSSYFILDITNPEVAPTLLGETTMTSSAGTDMGYATTISTMAIMKDFSDADLYGHIDSDWYLVLGSGPHGSDALKGVSDQNGKIAVVPLKTSNGSLNGTDLYSTWNMRIPDSDPTDTLGGRYLLSDADSFVSDLITIDFDINPSTIDYLSDAIYFGTVSGDFHATNGNWDGGGKLYRLVTRNNGNYGIGVVQQVSTPDTWMLKPLMNPNRPITGAPNVGSDDQDNFWVYFGTGRYYDPKDKTDTTQQAFYGIKEPMEWVDDTTRKFNWLEVTDAKTGDTPGMKGLLNVSEILVEEKTDSSRNLFCMDNDDFSNTDAYGNIYPVLDSDDDNCLPVGPGGTMMTTLTALENYIAGKDWFAVTECSGTNEQNCTDGWYKKFWPYNNRERNVGQSTLLGGLLLFTTYQPFDDVCKAEGLAYLYGLYYKTGTAWEDQVFGDYDARGTNKFNKEKYNLGVGLATTPNLHTGRGGDGNPKAFVQTSTGEIKEIEQNVSPLSGYATGRSKWKVYDSSNCP